MASVDAPLAAPDVPAEPLVAPLLLLLLHAAQKTVATIDKATGRLRAFDIVVILRDKARLSVPMERGAGLLTCPLRARTEPVTLARTILWNSQALPCVFATRVFFSAPSELGQVAPILDSMSNDLRKLARNLRSVSGDRSKTPRNLRSASNLRAEGTGNFRSLSNDRSTTPRNLRSASNDRSTMHSKPEFGIALPS